MSISEYSAALCVYMREHGFNLSEEKNINYGVQLKFSYGGGLITLRIYQNKKGRITLDTSPIHDEKIKALVSSFTPDGSAQSIAPNYPLLAPPLIGSDESGKGDYFGALVVAAVYADENACRELTAAGVRDSKQLTDDAMQKMRGEIVRICPIYTLVEIAPERLNALHEAGNNMNVLLGIAHAKAVASVHQKSGCTRVLCDKFGDERYIASNLRDYPLEITQVPRAEANPAVAAASILARCRFVGSLHALEKKYGCELPLGAGSGVDKAGRVFLKTHSREELARVAKIFFKNTEKL